MAADSTRVCMVCGREVEQNAGIHLLDHFLCNQCEHEMVNTSVDDVHYDHYVECLRELWFDLIA